jgi:hypothetical protein
MPCTRSLTKRPYAALLYLYFDLTTFYFSLLGNYIFINNINEKPIFKVIESYLLIYNYYFIFTYLYKFIYFYKFYNKRQSKEVSFDGASTSAKASDVSINL